MIPEIAILSRRIMGGMGLRLSRSLPGMGEKLDRSGLGIPPDAYASAMLFLALLVFASTLLIGSIVASMIGMPLTFIAMVLASSSGAGIATFFALYKYPGMVIGRKRRIIEEALPHVLSFMAVLSSAGIAPKRIIEALARMEQEVGLGLAGEGRRMYVEMELLGSDLITAFRRASERQISPILSGVLEGMIRTIETGGDLTSYLRDETRSLMRMRRSIMREFIDILIMISEIYMAVMVAFPLIMIVMLVIMSAIGGGAIAGMAPETIVPVIIYGMVPGIGTFLMLYLDAAAPRG